MSRLFATEYFRNGWRQNGGCIAAKKSVDMEEPFCKYGETPARIYALNWKSLSIMMAINLGQKCRRAFFVVYHLLAMHTQDQYSEFYTAYVSPSLSQRTRKPMGLHFLFISSSKNLDISALLNQTVGSCQGADIEPITWCKHRIAHHRFSSTSKYHVGTNRHQFTRLISVQPSQEPLPLPVVPWKTAVVICRGRLTHRTHFCRK